MIDLHCHLLPAVDDGPPDLGAALRLAAAQADAGIRTVAATPHVSPGFPGNDAALVERGVEELRLALSVAGIGLELIAAAELDLTTALELPDEQLERLQLGGGRLLIEAPLTPVAPLEPGVAALHERGFAVLLAHPERSPLLQRDPQALGRLVRAGVRTQLTAGGLGGQFGRTVQRFALSIAGDGLAHTFASDSHDTERRPPGLRAPLEAAGYGAYARLLCEQHPAELLAGAPLPETVELRRRGGLLGRLRG